MLPTINGNLAVIKGLRLLVKPAYKTGFNKVFGRLIQEVQNLPDNCLKHNAVLRETLEFFQKVCASEKETKSRHAVSSLLLTKQETALILQMKTNTVAQLTGKGCLFASQKKLEAYVPLYPLGLRILVNLNTYSVSFEHPELLTHCPV
ncbi:hypothetical protein [Endozoicomonas sp. SCSIO W0465]|uniref:hypothetical protein n=1 Tax=Endozoicomonas sp. SCSIO W0465 TaxID=2918516 RepID=UPI00207538D6|nr:hypothetical protein [Endozoicomonas sp. SCSIO W0465]USE37046.1 hypothetical protein MJO57_02070 [Endozoicomonas sp. SCSIO W0465]